jgi:transposase
MTNYVGLDVSQKTTVLCVIHGGGHRLWRGECTSSPDKILRAVLQHAGPDASIGIETGPMTLLRTVAAHESEAHDRPRSRGIVHDRWP